MARRSSFSSTTPTSESNIAFFAAGGHNHDGQNSSLIDASKYSIFDFDQGLIPSNSERAQAQQRNKVNFEDNIRDLLRTAGIELSANSINATQIIAGSITSTEIAANTITTNNLVSDILQSSNYSYTSGVFSDSGTFIDLSDGSIYSTNFAIDSSGNAYFTGDITGSSGTFSGIVSGGSVAGGTIDIGGADATSFHVDSSGNMWLGDAAYASAPFKVSSSGALTATSAAITGEINATSGTFSGNITSSATISGGTLTGTTITGSTLSAGNPTGDGVSITGTRVLINTTGGSGSGAARLKFNTNSNSGDNFIESDKRLVLTAGGSGQTKILVGLQDGSAQGVVNVEATDLQLNGTSVLTSGSLPSGTIWTSTNDGAGSGLHADLLDGYHASDFILNSAVSGTIWTSNNDGSGSGLHADKLDGYHGSDFALDGHGHSNYSTSSHLHDSRYELLGHTHNYLSTVSGGTVYGGVSFTSSSIYMTGLPSGFSGYVRWDTTNGRLQRSTSLRDTKTDVHSIVEILEYLDEVNPVQNLRPVIFKSMVTEEPDDAKHYNYGFIAEEVVDEIPESSLLGPNGELVMYDIDILAPLLTAEVQRLSKMVEELYKQANPDWTSPRERGSSSKEESLIDIEAYKNWIITREQAPEQPE
jgi:hypothetical protein